jgi:hypothetical protein
VELGEGSHGGGHGGLGFGARREEQRRERERGREVERMRERGRGGSRGLIPSGGTTAAVEIFLPGSTASTLPGSCLAPLRRRTTVEVGLYVSHAGGG